MKMLGDNAEDDEFQRRRVEYEEGGRGDDSMTDDVYRRFKKKETLIDAAARNWSRLGDVAAELGDVSDEAGAKAHAAFKRVQKLCVAAKIAAMDRKADAYAAACVPGTA